MNNQFNNIIDNINKMLFLNVLKQLSCLELSFLMDQCGFLKTNVIKTNYPSTVPELLLSIESMQQCWFWRKEKRKPSTHPMSQSYCWFWKKRRVIVFNCINEAMQALKRQLKQTTLSLFHSYCFQCRNAGFEKRQLKPSTHPLFLSYCF